jgi:glycosyltransferase involved in cell wall biosynthesis
VVGDAGLLVPPESPDRLADAMGECLDPDRRTDLAGRSTERVERFRIERTVEAYVRLYRRLGA